MNTVINAADMIDRNAGTSDRPDFEAARKSMTEYYGLYILPGDREWRKV